MDEPSVPAKLVGRGGAGRGQGRKPGTKSKYKVWFQEALAGENGCNLDAIHHRYLQLALVEEAPVFDKRGNPVMVDKLNDDGSPAIDKNRKRIKVQKTAFLKNVPYTVQMAAMDRIHDIVLGPVKATEHEEEDRATPITRLNIHLTADPGVPMPMVIDGSMKEIIHVVEPSGGN